MIMPSRLSLKGKILCFLLVLIALQVNPAVSRGEEFVIGVLPEMNVFKQMERFRPLAEYLSDKIGVDVKLTMISRYGNIIESLKEKRVNAAFLGSFTAALAISQLHVEPLARPVNMDGTSTYFGYLFSRNDSGIKNVSDMKGKVMVFVEKATTAGYLFPLAYLKSKGVADHQTFFKDFYFSGSHDAAIIAVLEGHADVGAAKNTIYERSSETDSRIYSDLYVIAKSPRVPSNGLCVVADTDPQLKKKLKETLLDLHNYPQGKVVLSKFGAQKFVQTEKDDYLPVMEMAHEAGIELSEYYYKNQ
ncbi:MAG: phosphate/phosphite/phosphonate ABC transporter substrate-binding protein [Proteobacteria bacterium]|nr:phosphate/phosphite/phosphonate ABC transporter substrate-binding protein [Pseudomonadota bacterium]MBU1709485.1 phosphate/phosphite/phosphonate ABC transporter substrate-binding protein [Pseudomonadota bacterium]